MTKIPIELSNIFTDKIPQFGTNWKAALQLTLLSCNRKNMTCSIAVQAME